MKESESEDDVECWQHARQFSELWYKSYDRVTRQAASDRECMVARFASGKCLA